MADHDANSPPQRLSRYRSQRRPNTQTSTSPHHPPPAPSSPHNDPAAPPSTDAFARSKSRYKRNTPSETGFPPAARDQRQIESAPRSQPTSPVSPPRAPVRPATSSQLQQQQQRNPSTARRYNGHNVSPPAPLASTEARRVNGGGSETNLATDNHRSSSQRNASKPVPAAIFASTAAPSKPKTDLPTPVVPDGPPTSDQIRATKSMTNLPYIQDGDDDAACFGLFKRKRGEAAPAGAEKTPIARTPNTREAPAIKAGGGGAVPHVDAPVSAVNAGDRHVLVECGKTKTLFPVTTSTTPVDLIRSAATCLSEPIDVRSAVLLEYFGTVGVQRPLRRYEHIRDVMNSWDSDRQNSLLLVDPGTGSSEAELNEAGVPSEKPGDESWIMSFSQKPGKWDKRVITLRSDGQITMQKEAGRPQDLVNVCHLSDFDIYTPTQEKLRKKIKPPKRICFAIKSQQKTIMFESTQNFVHFFCTGDKPTGDAFHAAVQGWRSWYLFNVMGEGRKPKSPPESRLDTGLRVASGDGGVSKTHRAAESLDSHYQLGSFKPLIDMDQFDSGKAPEASTTFVKSSNQFDVNISPERRTSRTRKPQPPISLSNKAQLAEDEPLANLARRNSTDRRRSSMDRPSDEFASTGLLGRTYSQRQREHAERENPRSQPFSTGPTLLNGTADNSAAENTSSRRSLDGRPPRRQSSTRHSDLKRISSRRDASGGPLVDLHRSASQQRRNTPLTQPLVDLTPQYREPPQHQRKGKGFRLADDTNSGPLIDNATSPDDPLGIPPSTDWRSRPPPPPPSPGLPPPQQQQAPLPSPSQDLKFPRPPSDQAFTGEGLLAAAQPGWGGGDKGRGVIDGSRATRGPLLDVTEASQFAHGSLLGHTVREKPAVPIIDRSKEED